MQTGEVPLEVQVLSSQWGGALAVITAIISFGLLFLWTRRPGHPERWPIFLASICSAVVFTIISVLALSAGWWGGPFFNISPVVQAALYLPLGTVGWAVWLLTYRWLAARTRHAFLIYAAMVLSFIPLTYIVDVINIERGQFTLGSGYSIWLDVIIGQIVMWTPILFYEFFSRRQAVVTGN